LDSLHTAQAAFEKLSPEYHTLDISLPYTNLFP
jgi:hypothetical protein